MGEYTTEQVLSDKDPNLSDFKNTLPHHAVNDALVAADGEGKYPLELEIIAR